MAKIKAIDKNDTLESTIRTDLEPRTELGEEVIRQFRMAVMTKQNTRVGDYMLGELLTDCYDARDDRTLGDEAELADKYPAWAAMPVSLVSFKVGILVALIRESLVDIARAPFIVDPTPNPEIPDTKYNEIMDTLERDVLQVAKQVTVLQTQFVDTMVASGVSEGDAMMHPDFPSLSPEEITNLVRQSKIESVRAVEDHAKEQAALLQKDLYDKTTEGGYRNAIIEFADDFATYPFGCIHGPFPTIKNDTVWKGDKFVEEQNVVWGFERVSPFDLFWTEDSSNTQDGAAIFIKKRVGYEYLYNARDLAASDPNSGYVLETLKELITYTEEGKIPRNWVDFFTSNPEVKNSIMTWSRGQSVEILIRYGKFSGHQLTEMGFTSVDATKLYETKVIMCGGQVVHCQINKNPSQYKRPVFTASFESRNGSIVGVGLGQKLLSLHKAYRAVTHLALFNLGLSSEPITEIDVHRILEYMPDEWVEDPSVGPGQVIPATGDRLGNGSRAVKFTQIPNTTASCIKLAEHIFDLTHVISNIPAALHGQPVGSGANRTVRGLLTLQGNTLKPIHSALMNLDLGAVEPMVTLLYMLLVMYDDDFQYSGDCKIVAKGAASMIQREMDKQAAMENIQILGQLGENVNPELMNRAISKLLTLSNILEPGEEAMLPTAPPTPVPNSPQ